VGKILLAAVGTAVFLLSAPAMAADISAPAPIYQAAPIPTPIMTWTGPYVGLNIGGIWSSNQWTDTVFNQNIGTINGRGLLGGAQAGFDYQISPNWLVGIRAMFDGTGFRKSQPENVFCFGCELTASAETSWFATLTGRGGYLWLPTLLFYGKAGAAWVSDEYSQTVNGGLSARQQITRTGFDVGAGFEWMFVQNWSLFAEYDFAGFGSAHVNNLLTAADIHQNVQVILAGFNYRFTPRY
jgi:outer membrane immunogenic protein